MEKKYLYASLFIFAAAIVLFIVYFRTTEVPKVTTEIPKVTTEIPKVTTEIPKVKTLPPFSNNIITRSTNNNVDLLIVLNIENILYRKCYPEDKTFVQENFDFIRSKHKEYIKKIQSQPGVIFDMDDFLIFVFNGNKQE